MEPEQITALGDALVPVLAIAGTTVSAVVAAIAVRRAAENTAAATTEAARIARDQNREADVRQRRVDAYGPLAHECASVVEAMEEYGDIGLRLAVFENQYQGTPAEGRQSLQDHNEAEAAEAEKQADAVWDAMPSDRQLRERLLDVELVGPPDVITTARAYVSKLDEVRKEIIEGSLRDGLASGVLNGPAVVKCRNDMQASMRFATGSHENAVSATH